MISTTGMTNALSKEQVMKFIKNYSVENMKDMLSGFILLYIFGGIGLYLDQLEAIFIPEIKNYALGRVIQFYVYLSINIMIASYTYPIIYNLPEYKQDLLNWRSNVYDYIKSLFTIKKLYTQPDYEYFHSEDAFHKKIQQFTKNKEL